MIKVGITGGIGCGKTTVAKVFEVLGIPVYYADDAARELMNNDEHLKALIKEHFSEKSYMADGKLNRAWMSETVFADNEKLALLNSFVHPATIRHAQQWMEQQTSAYAVKEAALIFESGSQAELDIIIGVYAPAAVRMQLAMKRNNITREEVQARMDKQLQESIKMRLCDMVITNDGREAIIPQVMKIHETLLLRAGG